MSHFPTSYPFARFAREVAQRVSIRGSLVLALLLPLLLTALLVAVAPAQVALAEDTPTLQIDKSIYGGLSTVQSGAPFKYVFAYKCASITTNCNDATLVDTLPPGLELLGVDLPPGTNVSASFDPATRKVTIYFGNTLQAGSSGFITLNVRFEPGTTPGSTVTNSVVFTATNATTVSDSAPPIDPTGVFEMYAQKRLLSSPAVQGEPIEFALELCSPDEIGGVRFVDPVMVDTIPAGATFVSAQGTQGVDWTYDTLTRKLTFLTLPNPAPVGGCITRTMKLSYPIGSSPITGQINTLDITGTPEGCTGLPLPAYCGGVGPRTLNTTLPFGVGVPFPSLDVTKSSAAASSFYGTEALVGEAVTYTIGAQNNGFLNLTNVVVTDTIPAQYDLKDFTVSPNNGISVTAFYRTSAAPDVWVPLPGNPFTTTKTVTVASLNLSGGVDGYGSKVEPRPHESSGLARLAVRDSRHGQGGNSCRHGHQQHGKRQRTRAGKRGRRQGRGSGHRQGDHHAHHSPCHQGEQRHGQGAPRRYDHLYGAHSQRSRRAS